MQSRNKHHHHALIAYFVLALLFISFSGVALAYGRSQEGAADENWVAREGLVHVQSSPPESVVGGVKGATVAPDVPDDDDSARWPGNRPVPEDWLSCVRSFLRLDAKNRPQLTTHEMAGAIPLLVTPVFNDAHHLPRLLCSIDVPVRYYFVVLNGRDPLAVKTVAALESEFGPTGRLVVQRNGETQGYSGSVNQGLRWGIERKTNAEVPWFFLCSCDVAFGGTLLTKLVDEVARLTKDDARVLKELEEEVGMEERLAKQRNYSYYNRWVPAQRPLMVLRSGYPGVAADVHTAPLLPDRIRYMYAHRSDGTAPADPPLTERIFSNHYGMIVPVANDQSAVVFTRLMVSTVGYLDENFCRPHMEAIDMRWRMSALGFRKTAVMRRVKKSRVPRYFYHHHGSDTWGGGEETRRRLDAEENSAVAEYRGALRGKGPYYKLSKFGACDRDVWGVKPVGCRNAYKFFNASYFPVDVWVTDYRHQLCFDTLEYSYREKRWVRPQKCVYNCNAVIANGVLGVDQIREMRCVDGNKDVVRFV